MTFRLVDVLFFLLIAAMLGIDAYCFLTLEDPANLKIILCGNGVLISILACMIGVLSYRLAHVPFQEKDIKPSRRRA